MIKFLASKITDDSQNSCNIEAKLPVLKIISIVSIIYFRRIKFQFYARKCDIQWFYISGFVCTLITDQ